MKPAPFDYYAPTSLAEALERLAQYGSEAKPLAGGQSLIPMMNFRLALPAVLIDLNNIPDLAYLRLHDSELRLGAMTRNSTIEHEPLVAEHAPLLAATMPHIAYPAIRNRGTFGGNIAHADPAAQLPAVTVALQGRCRLRNRAGERWVTADDFFVGTFSTVLQPDELLIEVALPPLPPRSGWSYRQVARQHGDYAMVGAAAMVALDDRGRCGEARLVFLGVGDRPVVARQAAQALIGQSPTPEAIRNAAAIAARADVDPGSDIHASAAYRRHLTEVLTRHALGEAFERAGRSL